MCDIAIYLLTALASTADHGDVGDGHLQAVVLYEVRDYMFCLYRKAHAVKPDLVPWQRDWHETQLLQVARKRWQRQPLEFSDAQQLQAVAYYLAYLRQSIQEAMRPAA